MEGDNKNIYLNGTQLRNQTFREKHDESEVSAMPSAAQGATFLEQLSLTTPAELHAGLSKYVIGQERAKVTVCVAAANHYKRAFLSSQNRLRRDDPNYQKVILKKANVLLIGPTGSGKTHIVTSLAEILGVPFTTVAATSLTATGFVGRDVESIIKDLVMAAAGIEGSPARREEMITSFKDNPAKLKKVVEKAEQGIVFIDEIDKIRSKGTNNSAGVDVGGQAVQQALLTMMEGAPISINLSGPGNYPLYASVDTSNILFMCGGAFVGLDKIVKARLAEQNADYDEDDENILRMVKEPDLVRYGLIPEFIGRVPIVTTLDALTEQDFIDIITQPKDALQSQFTALFKLDNANFQISEDAKRKIARDALAKNRGARGLRTVLEELLTPTMFVAPSLKKYAPNVVLTGGYKDAPLEIYIECDTNDVEEVRQVISRLPGSDEVRNIAVRAYTPKDFV